MRRWMKAALILLGIALLLACCAAFVLPVIIRNQAEKRVAVATGRTLAIGHISINPFALRIKIADLRLSERSRRETFASFSSASIRISPTSIFRWAPIISEAQFSSPHLHIVRTGANSYNFSDLLEGTGKRKGNKEGPPRFSLNNVAISNGSVDFIDRGLAVEKHHELRRVNVGIPFVTTMPYLADRYITPRFSAVLNGSPLAAEGRLRPFPHAAEASATIDLKDLSLPYYLSYLPAPLPVRVESGNLSTKVSIRYRAAQRENPELAVSGSVSLVGAKVSDRSGAPLAGVARLDADITDARLISGQYTVSTLSADGLDLHVSRDKRGTWNHSRLTAGSQPSGQRRKTLVSVADVRLKNGVLHFRDDFNPLPFATDIRDIALDMRGYSTAPGKSGTFTMTFASQRGESGEARGSLSPVPLTASSDIKLSGVDVAAYHPYLMSLVRVPVKGRADIGGKLTFSRADGLTLEQVSIRSRQLSAPFGDKEMLTLAPLAVDGGRYSARQNLLEVNRLGIKGGVLRFSRDSGGGFSPVANLLAPKEQKGPSHKAPLQYRLARVSVANLDLVFTDRKLEEPETFAFSKVAFSLERVSGPHFGSMLFTLSASYGPNGSLGASGTIMPTPFNLKGEVALRSVPFSDFNGYLPSNLEMVVAEGNVDARLALALESNGNALAGTFGGSANVSSLYCLDAEGEDLLKWDSLRADALQGSLAPFSLQVKDLALSHFYSRIVVEKDGTLNLQHLYRAPAGKKAAVGQPKGEAAGANKGTIRIDAVTMQDGTLAFSDRHLAREYSSVFYNLGGRISGLSSGQNSLADVDLRGNLENQSPLRITGRINPLADELFADLKVRFSDIELSPMTPYSGTYLGYAVNTGKLTLDLKYRIQNRKLESENKVFIDQFNFGRRIESDKATTLPVRLAVALLKNRKGEINLDLPVTGRTDDPQFSVWRVMLGMIKNLVVKAATSPLTLLQSLFGEKRDWSSVTFDYGSSEVSGSERDKILKLATALADRPALKIGVMGFVDREHDPEGYRNELLLKRMRTEKFLDLVKEKKNRPGESPETVRIAPEEYGRYLKQVYDKETFPKPRNILGLVKSLPETEMRKLILANIVVGEEQLQGLADARAARVREVLVDQGKVNSAQVFQKRGNIFKPAEKGGGGSRVEFGVAVE